MNKVFILIAVILLGCTSRPYQDLPTQPNIETSSGNFTVANWNLQIFGTSKAKDIELMNTIASEVEKYDIVFVQEIRDSSDTAFPALCLLVSNDYDCRVSSRAGRSSSKEQYGVLYRRYITITNWTDYSPDVQDRWERPPLEVTFNVKGYNFTAFNIHTKPSDVPNELSNMIDLADTVSGNVMIIGDLNADCDYYSQETIPNWSWDIPNEADTTTGKTDCAYDRVLTNTDMNSEFVDYGIGEGYGSDHYLVWAEFEAG